MNDVDALERAASHLNTLAAGDPEALAAVLTPQAARTLAVIFQVWGRMGGWNEDLLNRIGGPQTVRLARILCGETVADGEETL